VELVETKDSGSEVYKVSFIADPPSYLPIDLMRKILPIGGLLAICLFGGSIGYFFDARFV
jgi:hypothetical protein